MASCSTTDGAGVEGLKPAFEDFCDKGSEITSANAVKLFKKAHLFGKNCTSNSVDIAFAKVKTDKKKKTINFNEFKNLINVMAADYGKDHKKNAEEAEIDMINKISSTKNVAHGTKISKTGNVAGMTDASKYTGSHKERFDADGKGKGKEGREDVASNDGYVGNYKGKDTFDDKE